MEDGYLYLSLCVCVFVCVCVSVFAGCADIQGNFAEFHGNLNLKSSIYIYKYMYLNLNIIPHCPWKTCGEFQLLCFDSGAHDRFRSWGGREKFAQLPCCQTKPFGGIFLAPFSRHINLLRWTSWVWKATCQSTTR